MASLAFRKTIKHHLKNNEVECLSKKAKGIIRKKSVMFGVSFPEEEGELPVQLRSFIQPMEDFIKEASESIKSDETLIKNALYSLSDEQLEMIKDVFREKSSVLTEQKLVATAMIMIKELSVVHQLIPYLQNLKVRMLEVFVDAYSSEYHYSKSSSVIFNNDLFMSQVDAVINYRQGVKRATQLSTEDRDKVISPEGDKACVIM